MRKSPTRKVQTLMISRPQAARIDVTKPSALRGFTLSSSEEAVNMTLAEQQQTSIDKFWGLDKEANDRECENNSMRFEDDRSALHEIFCKKIDFQQIWEEEIRREKYSQSFTTALRQISERRSYMDSLFSTSSGGKDIHKLNTFPPTTPWHIDHYNLKPDSATTVNVSVHMDGLQQGKGVTGMTSATIERMLIRSSNPISMADKAIQYAQQTHKTSSISNTLRRVDDTDKGARTKRSLDGSHHEGFGEAMITTEREPRHSAVLDGHPIYRWDQEMMLTVVFNRLCSLSGRSSIKTIRPQDLSLIGRDAECREILRLTVFGSYIKRRMVDVLLSLLFAADADPSSVPSASGQAVVAVASLADWIGAARSASREEGVPFRYIRTVDEHRGIAARAAQAAGTGTGTVSVSSVRARRVFAAEARDRLLTAAEKRAQLQRGVAVGDLVWGLHGGGVVWLPAVVHSGEEAEDDGGGTYGLTYIFSQPELEAAKAAAARLRIIRHLQPSGSGRTGTGTGANFDNPFDGSYAGESAPSSSSSTAEALLPRSLQRPSAEERQLLGYAFDLVDQDGAGLVPLSQLLQGLCSPGLRGLVQASAALSTLFADAPDAQALREVFKEVVEMEAEAEAEASGEEAATAAVSRAVFVDFCLNLAEISVFNSYGLLH